MSIHDEIIDRCQRNMLFPLIPKSPGATIRRAMLVCESLHAEMNSPEGDDEWEERIGNLMADLEYFVTGEDIYCKYLFLLAPARDCVWEVRSAKDSPSIRVFCLFAGRDMLVSTNFARRDALGGWESVAWKLAKRTARSIWRQVFPAYEPIVFSNIHDMVSGGIDGKYFK